LADSFGFFVFGGAGLAEVDPAYSVEVSEDATVPPPPSQLDNPPTQQLSVYRRMGSAFGTVGLGIFVPVGRTTGLLLDGKAMVLFPSSGLAFSFGGGLAFGL
jgi:hypothetical protein